MDVQPKNLAEEIKRLQRCINDLVSVLALPAMWSGGEPSQIVHTLLDALLGMLQLDLVYVRLKDPAGQAPIEMVRFARSQKQIAQRHQIADVLNQWLGADPQEWPPLIRDRIGGTDISIVPFGLGLQGELGVIVAGSARADFPVQTERLILSVAANEASIGLQEARLLSEQKRVASELDHRVTQRTAQLAATNEELRKENADRKRAEEALRSSERDLSLIIETIPGLVWCAAPDGELNYLNRRMQDYTGTTSGAWAQLRWTNFLHPDDVEPTVSAWSRSVNTGLPYEIQCRLRRSDDIYRWFQVLGQAAHDNDGRVTRWYGLLVDIDDRKNMEEALRGSERRLSRATRTATVGEFAASIAHEINQPLSAVVTNGHACLRWLSAEPPGLDKAREAAERIVRDGKEAGEVVRRIRALFKQASPLAKIDLDLNEVIGEVLVLLDAETMRRRVVVETNLDKDLVRVAGDRMQLQQLVFNLLLNAIEAMDPVLDRPKKLFISSKRHGPENVLVEVRDCGPGLADPGKVFEAFFTTKENGLGMGLAVCRSIIDAHRGRLWAASGENQGTTFSFTLPVAALAAAS